MMLAIMAGADLAVGFVLIVALAIVVAIVGVFGLFLKAIAATFRGLTRLGGGSKSRHGFIDCPHSRCGHRNVRAARFCAKCGMPLRS